MENLQPDRQTIYFRILSASPMGCNDKNKQVGQHSFKTEGRVLVEPSWLAIYGKDNQPADTLAPLTDADQNKAKLLESKMETDQTKPPPRYSEATLLSAMEGAGKLVEDEELAEALKEKGLGTPATRAATIEHLIKEKYVRREGTQLHPSIKAEDLFDFLHASGVEVLTSPAMTGEWEYKLRKIEEGEMTREEFMREISKVTEDFVSRTTGFTETADNLKETELVSPINGEPIYEGLIFTKIFQGNLKFLKVLPEEGWKWMKFPHYLKTKSGSSRRFHCQKPEENFPPCSNWKMT